MKKIISIVTLIFVTTVLFGQIDLHENENEVFNNNKSMQDEEFAIMQEKLIIEAKHNFVGVKNVKGTIWVQDSTYYYYGVGTEWNLSKRYKVLDRDQYGNMINAIKHSYNSETEIWTNRDTITAIYYNTNLLHKYLEIRWDNNTQQWANDTINYREYDGNNNLIINIHSDELYFWDRLLYTYDENENLIQKIYQNRSNGTWINKWIDLCTYENNNQTQKIIQEWDNNTEEWINRWQHLYTYDDNNSLTQEIEQTWDSNTEEWLNHYQYLYTYDENGNKTQTIKLYWHSDTEEWLNSWLYLYTYDNNNNQTQDLRQTWDSNTEEWNNAWQDLYSYDENGNLIQRLYQNWNDDTEEWISYWQFIYVFDTNNNQIQYIYKKRDSDTGELENDKREDYFWSELEVATITNINSDEIIIYPNPASDKIQFLSSVSLDNATIEIYSISGKIVNNISANNNNEINISNLSKGIYIIKINSETVNFVEKFIKE